VSRLYDRILSEGCRPWSFQDWPARSASPEEPPIPERARFPTALESLDLTLLDDAFVVVADDAARYLDQHAESLRTFDVVTNVAPPLPRMFIEFRAPTRYGFRHGLHTWGVLVDSTDLRSDPRAQGDGVRWMLDLYVIFEPRKGYCCGPVARGTVFARNDGTLDRMGNEGLAYGCYEWVPTDPAWFAPDVDNDDFTTEIEEALWELTVPALFALSLMHCRNVTAEPVDPPAALSRKYRRRTGRPLTRYHVLNIEPMSRVLDAQGEAGTKGLGHALNICRGHFKRYTDDAPLFGRYTGHWWWAAHERGRAEHGVVVKDYRLLLDELGSEYRHADKHAELAEAAEARVRDPDSAGRGLRAHALTQNAFADALEVAGFAPRSPKAKEPPYDLGWETNHQVWIAEVKSLTAANEERQLRAALSQLLRYRQALVALGYDVRAVVAAEHEPGDSSWHDLLAQEQIDLVWSARFADFIAKMNE